MRRQLCRKVKSVQYIMGKYYEQHEEVSAALPWAATGPLHSLKPGDYVLVGDLWRKNWRAGRWQGPFQVLLVKVAERATWVHVSHCKQVVAGKLQEKEKSDVPSHQ